MSVLSILGRAALGAPFVYLGFLGIFIILSLCLVAFFQRRKDIVR